MTRAMTALAITALLAAGCSKQESSTTGAQNMPNMPAASTPTSTGTAEIAFRSAPPRVGENSFDVTVMQDGRPVDGAQVSIEFFMPAMPQMNMAEMRTKTDLMPMGQGMYQGKGQVVMAGDWSVTVTAMKDGQAIGRRQLTVTAK
jgi:uncharacterized GH25 family protein